jgi:hypothetical protein
LRPICRANMHQERQGNDPKEKLHRPILKHTKRKSTVTGGNHKDVNAKGQRRKDATGLRSRVRMESSLSAAPQMRSNSLWGLWRTRRFHENLDYSCLSFS